MKLAHPDMENTIDIDPSCINTLIIENPAFFREYLTALSRGCNGEEVKPVLSEGLKTLDMSKWAEIIDSYLTFTVNRKNLLTKLTTAVEKIAADGEYFLRSSELICELERFINELSMECTADIVCTKLNMGNILRAVGISVREDEDNILERIVDYMELTREYDRDRLFIFVNLRSYYTDEELAPFIGTVVSHEYKVLLIDNFAYPRLPLEKRLTVDIDLCEF